MPRVIRQALVIVLSALVLEAGLFNYQHWMTLGYTAEELLDKPYTVKSEDDVLTFKDIDTEIDSLRIAISEPKTLVFASLEIADEGFRENYEAALLELHADVEQSLYTLVHAYGRVTDISLVFPEAGNAENGTLDEDAVANSFPIVIDSVQINPTIPFSFSLLRFCIAASVLLCVFAFRPKSILWKIPAIEDGSERHTAAIRIVSKSLVSFACLTVMCACFLSHPDWVLLATSFYNSENWDGISLVNQVDSPWPNAALDEYSELARSFCEGKLYLDEEPPEWLAQADNPRDPEERAWYVEHTGEDYKTDAAYFDGHYYVYFGVVPVLALYLPYHLLTGGDFPDSLAVFLLCSLYLAGLAFLLRTVIRRWFPQCPLSVELLLLLGLFAGSGIPMILVRPSTYQVPIAFACMLVVWALALWIRGLDGHRGIPLAAGSFLAACTLGSRPTVACVMIGLAVIVIVSIIRRSNMALRQRRKSLLIFVLPALVVVAGLMWYNAARFGSPFDFGADYNLTSNDMTLRSFNPERLADGLFTFLLQPPQVTSVFPFIECPTLESAYVGKTFFEQTAGGLLATCPFYWGSALAVLLVGAQTRRTRLLTAFFFFAAIVLCCVDTQLAGILGRYTSDFALFFALASGLAVLHFFSHLPQKRLGVQGQILLTGYQAAWCVLVFASFAFAAAMFFYGLSAVNGNYSVGPVDFGFYEQMRQIFEFWV